MYVFCGSCFVLCVGLLGRCSLFLRGSRKGVMTAIDDRDDDTSDEGSSVVINSMCF